MPLNAVNRLDAEGRFAIASLCPSPSSEAVYERISMVARVYDRSLIKSQLACSPVGD